MSANSIPSKENLLKLLSLYYEAPRPILIHCQGGADRTGEAAALWVLTQMGQSKHEALKQLALKYGHQESKKPAKAHFIRMWQGRDWAFNEYDPS